MTSNIKSINSPTHPIQFEFGDSPQQANIKLVIISIHCRYLSIYISNVIPSFLISYSLLYFSCI